MATKWIGPTFSLLLCCLLVSGCATRIQKSLDRSVLIAKRCADIEEAVPNRKDVEDELVNAIALRLVATCFDGSKACLGVTQASGAPSPVTSAGKLLTDLEEHRAVLFSMLPNLLHTSKDDVESLKQEHENLRRELTRRRDGVATALSELYKGLKDTRTMLGDSLSQARACERRTSCVAALGRQLSMVRLTLDAKVRDLHQKAQDLRDLAETAQSLVGHTTTFIDGFGTSLAVAGQQAVMEANRELQRDTADLVASSTYVAERLEAGARTLDSLFSAEVQDAATDLLAARLYDRVADKTVVAIDRLLSQVDRTIDKVDEHAYGAATLGTYLFEDEMQDKFDAIFTTYVADYLPDTNKTAKLAFAAAACRRLVPDNDNGARNASLFSSFVYAALIRMEVDLAGGRTTRESVRKRWEQDLNRSDSQSIATGQKSDTAFLGLVADAYRADSSPDGMAQRAPSILQQVALCAGVEQQLASTRRLDPAQVKERSQAACGKAVMSATLMGHGLPDAASPTLAVQAMEKAKTAASVQMTGGEDGPGDATAWRRAMEAVLAASVPKPPSSAARLCQRIRSGAMAPRCQPDGSINTVTVDFEGSFGAGKVSNRALELQIARLADMLAMDGRMYVFTVYGYASFSAYSCNGAGARTTSSCRTEKNHALAKARADWSLDVLRKRMPGRVASGSQAVGLFNPLSFDTPADRRIRMTVSLAD